MKVTESYSLSMDSIAWFDAEETMNTKTVELASSDDRGRCATQYSFAVLFFLVAVMFLLPGPVSAVTYYVRTDGNNNCTGLVNQGGSSGGCAWQTLQKAASTMAAGDTVNVAAGNYAGFMMQTAGTSGSRITFRAIGTGVNITTRNPTTADGINIESWGAGPANYITIDGFNVYNQTRMGIRAIGGTGIIIQNCTVHNNVSNGIFSGDTPNIQVLANSVYANGSSLMDHNVYISNALSDGAIVRGNVIYDSNAGNGLQLNGDWEMGGDGFIDNAVIEENVVHGNALKGLSLISIRYGRIQNNVIYNNGSAAGGIHLVDQLGQKFSTGNIVVNNTIHETAQACVRINSGSISNHVFNNIIVGSTGIVFEGSGNFQSNNYLSSNGAGLFVNITTRDYHLAQGSPAIEYGVASYLTKSAPSVDFDDNVRPQGTGYDSGAYEYGSGGGAPPPAVPALYLSPTGTDNASCGPSASPCATFAYVFSNRMSGGETLIVKDGTYFQRLANPPSGTAGAYTIIKAEHDGLAIISDGTSGNNAVVTISGSYIQLEGFKVVSTASGGMLQAAFTIPNDGHHNKILRCGFTVTPCNTGNSACENRANVDVSGHDNLMEDCWAWGGGRYKFIVFGGDDLVNGVNNILRRCVVRHDREYSGGYNPQAAFCNYQAKNTHFQNCLIIDSNQLSYYDSPGVWKGAFWLEKGQKGGFVKIDGTIALDFGDKNDATFIIDNSGGNDTDPMFMGGNIAVKNSVAYGGTNGFFGWPDGQSNNRVLSIDHSFIGNINSKQLGDYNDRGGFSGGLTRDTTQSANAISTNSIYYSIVADGTLGGNALFRVKGANNYNSFFSNYKNYGMGSTVGANDITNVNPLAASLLYPVRIEAGSPLKGTGSGGSDIGPTILKRIGVSGTLYGETGYDTVTSVNLWPWPNEGRIKSDMSAYPTKWPADGLPSPLRGFTTGNSMDGSPQTLTKYIWEYFGHQIPCEIYGTCGGGSAPLADPKNLRAQ